MTLTPLEPWIAHKIGANPPVVSRQEISAWQLRKLNETLTFARANSAYYRQHFAGKPDSISHLHDLSQFPFTTPADLSRYPLQFVCVSQDEIQRVVTLQSSGTTGAPKRFFFTAEDLELTIDFFQVGMSSLTGPGERVLILLPGETPASVGDLLRIGLERLGAEPVPYGPVRDPLDALEIIHSRQIDCLVGSPTQVLGLARRWDAARHKPRSVLLSTDYVPAAIVTALQQVWDCQVFNHYGATEMGLGGGVECAQHRGYHLREADLLFEIVDPNTGEPVPDGQYGEVVFSTLTRRGMPLIRCRMGDRSRFIPGDCPCGTTLKTLEKVSGRFDGFVTVGSEVLRLAEFDEALFSIPNLLNFSITLAGDAHHPSLTIDAQMLTSSDSTPAIEQALSQIPAMKDIPATIHCQHHPKEAGSLRKRAILDKRGQNA